MKSFEEIKNILANHKENIKTKFNVKEIGIFGSCVKNNHDDKSDIDILVDFEKPIDFFKFLDLEEYLENLVNAKIDLVSKKALKPIIGKYILEEVQLI